MTIGDWIGVAWAAVFAITFGVILLYLFALLRLARVAKAEHPDIWSTCLGRWPHLESEIQPAGRFLLRHLDAAARLGLKPSTSRIVAECRALLAIGILGVSINGIGMMLLHA